MIQSSFLAKNGSLRLKISDVNGVFNRSKKVNGRSVGLQIRFPHIDSDKSRGALDGDIFEAESIRTQIESLSSQFFIFGCFESCCPFGGTSGHETSTADNSRHQLNTGR